MVDTIKKFVKSSFRIFGLDLARLDPAELNKFVWLRNRNINTILDVGANTGQFARMIHQALPSAMIYSFEPLGDCYEELVMSMKDVRNFRAFKFALGGGQFETHMHRSEFSPSSSILQMGELHRQAFPQTSRTKEERISVRALDDVVPDLECDDNLLIKLDVQGYEDRVINGARKVLARASVLIVETSFERLYDDQPLFDAIFDMLRQLDYKYHGSLSQLRNPLDGSVLQADSIFIKE